uniref:Piwi domain-containing protein n=1 Tax=Globodera pallida TaxID=36090 RepID=A0A183BX34_GLOPA
MSEHSEEEALDPQQLENEQSPEGNGPPGGGVREEQPLPTKQHRRKPKGTEGVDNRQSGSGHVLGRGAFTLRSGTPGEPEPPGKRSRLVLIGSIASGMAFDESADINFGLFFYAALSPFRRTFMEAIAVALENFYDEKPSGYRMTRRPSIISTYRVPVVFGWFDNGRQFDIQFPRADFQSVRNTLMVRYYVQIDHL